MKHVLKPEPPRPFNESALLANTWQRGWNHGLDFAGYNVPELGKTSPVLGSDEIVTAENIREIHRELCFQAEEHSRSYTPFEFTAAEFNRAPENGGYAILYHAPDDMSEEVYATREEAEAAAVAEGWLAEDVIEFACPEELWEAFDAGIAAAITAELEAFEDADYGITEAVE
jgi:hypothetical protein